MSEPLDLALMHAAYRVTQAADGNGLAIVLLPEDDLYDREKVRQKVFEVAQSFAPNTAFVQTNGEYAAALNLCHLSQLLAELLKNPRFDQKNN